MNAPTPWQFRGHYRFYYLLTDEDGQTHGGVIYRNLKKQVTVDVAGKPRFLKQRLYLIRRHHD